MAEVKFSIKMDTEKKALMESLSKDNYRTLAGEINFAVDFYLNHLRETGATFIQLAPSSTQRHPVESKGIQQSPQEPTEVKLNINSFDEEIDDL